MATRTILSGELHLVAAADVVRVLPDARTAPTALRHRTSRGLGHGVLVVGVTPPPKTCASCGRMMAWRKGWASNWDEVRYCSDRCRRRKVRPVDAALEAEIRSLLAARARGATICPSEAARSVDPEGWRDLMEPTRAAARRLVASGEVEITQGNRVVDPSTTKGPIRIRRSGP